MNMDKNFLNTMHVYACNCMDDQIKVIDSLIDKEDKPTPEQLPEAPTVPKSKKKKKPASDELENSELVSLSTLERIEKREVESLK